MKRTVISFLMFFLFFSALSQEECDYKINVQIEEENFLLTKPQLVEFLLGKEQNVFIYFSLMKDGEVPSVVLEVSINSMEMPPVLCFDNSSRLTFQLDDNSIVSLAYLGEPDCGDEYEKPDGFDNTTSRASFYLDPENTTRLLKGHLKTMRIVANKTNFDFEFKNVISNTEVEIPIYPKEYFITNLKCLE